MHSGMHTTCLLTVSHNIPIVSPSLAGGLPDPPVGRPRGWGWADPLDADFPWMQTLPWSCDL